jgi:hypothetical protein
METKEINLSTAAIETKSTAKTISYFVWILGIANLFYYENWGLNALLATGISILAISIFNPSNLKHAKWWLVSVLWLIVSFGVFMNGTFISILLYWMTFFFFLAVSNQIKISLPLGIPQSFYSFGAGMVGFFDWIYNSIDGKRNNNKKLLINFLIIGIPLVIIIIFLKLYQSADETFYELTKFINLDWISWNFIAFYSLLVVFLYGFFFYTSSQTVQQWEEKYKNNIPQSYTDKIQSFLGGKNELKAAIGLLITLNVLLLLYNAIDIRYLIVEMPNPARDLSLSEMVHEGINSLITSIILVIVIITFLFRGKLNFMNNKIVKIMALFWLAQNIIMICTTGIKNYEYIHFWGLTYKRMGVIIYLALALIGISFTVYKILKTKSIWFLIRNVSISFMVCFSLLITFNWNRFIANYNLTNVEYAHLDFDYLIELGPDTYPSIIAYEEKNGGVPSDILLYLVDDIPKELATIKKAKSNNSWRSMVWSEETLYSSLKSIQFIYQ